MNGYAIMWVGQAPSSASNKYARHDQNDQLRVNQRGVRIPSIFGITKHDRVQKRSRTETVTFLVLRTPEF